MHHIELKESLVAGRAICKYKAIIMNSTNLVCKGYNYGKNSYSANSFMHSTCWGCLSLKVWIKCFDCRRICILKISLQTDWRTDKLKPIYAHLQFIVGWYNYQPTVYLLAWIYTVLHEILPGRLEITITGWDQNNSTYIFVCYDELIPLTYIAYLHNTIVNLIKYEVDSFLVLQYTRGLILVWWFNCPVAHVGTQSRESSWLDDKHLYRTETLIPSEWGVYVRQYLQLVINLLCTSKIQWLQNM